MLDIRPRPPGRTAVLTLALALAASLAACRDRDVGPAPGTPTAIPTTAVLDGTSRALLRASTAADPSPRLHAVGADGAVRPVRFQDADGAPLAAAVTALGALSRDWAWLRVSVAGPTAASQVSRQLLLRIADGALVDAEHLWLSVAQVKDGTLYAHLADRRTLARIDLRTMAAVPLNDPVADPLAIPFLVDHQGNVRSSTLRADGSFETKIFFADGSPPIRDPWRAPGTWEGLCAGGSPGYATAYGEDGHVYAVCSDLFPDPEGSTSTSTVRGFFVREVSFTPSGTRASDGPPVREPVSPGLVEQINAGSACRLDAPSRFLLPTTAGGLRTSPAPEGGISLAWTALALPRGLSWIAGEYGYWESHGTIARIRLATGATPETLVATPPVRSWTVAGGVVLFTGAPGGIFGTYAVTGPGLDPALVSSAALEVLEAVDL